MMVKPKKYGALFDLDGVVIDSEGAYTEFWAEIGRRYGAKSPTFAHDIKGTTLTDILGRYFPDDDIRESIKSELDEFEARAPFPLFEEAVRFLEELSAAGIPTAMVTSSDDSKMQSLRRRHPDLESMFDVVITGTMVSKSKPHPEGYLRASEALGVPVERCAVFEDSLQGLEAGRKANAGKVIALATTNPAHKLVNKADVVVDDFSGITVNSFLEIME